MEKNDVIQVLKQQGLQGTDDQVIEFLLGRVNGQSMEMRSLQRAFGQAALQQQGIFSREQRDRLTRD